MSKTYVCYVNDHSGSMMDLAEAAIVDYNASVEAVKQASSREMQDTIVSVVAVGVGPNNRGQRNRGTTRQVTVSNPHVLKPINSWSTDGGTPLYDGIGDMINMMKQMPDVNKEDVSFLVLITTDGEETHSTVYNVVSLKTLMQQMTDTGRWTFVFRVPKGKTARQITELGVSKDNIQEWETTAVGMAQSTKATTAAVDTFYAARSAGAKSTTAFYADASKVNLAALKDITNELSLYVVRPEEEGMEIRNFILTKRMACLKGSAFYQLTKTEARVGHDKMIIVRDQATGKMFSGKEAREMIGLPTDRNARLHPGDHKNYDLFIQSFSTNRKLVGGTGVLYWQAIGTKFTQEEIDRFKPVAPAAAPVVQLPKVPVSVTPTKSPIPVTPQVRFYPSRQDARNATTGHKKKVVDLGPLSPKGKRWTVQ
jgi:hypothetical protein